MDLPGWQALSERLGPQGVEIVTVALDTAGIDAAGPWIEAAAPTHPSLIDEAHVVDELFGIVNVPNAVWIDESGTVVRPAEPAWPGSTPVLNIVERIDELPPAAAATAGHIARMHIEPDKSLAMLLDWAAHGSDSRFALDPDEVIARSRPRSMDLARAAAHFELGQYLHRSGDHPAAVPHWRDAHRLDPDNWTYKRQAWVFETGDTVTQSAVYEGSWLRDVEAIGAEHYYPKVED